MRQTTRFLTILRGATGRLYAPDDQTPGCLSLRWRSSVGFGSDGPIDRLTVMREEGYTVTMNSTLTWAVDVGAVLNAEYGYKTDLVVDLVQNAEGAPPRGVEPFELVV